MPSTPTLDGAPDANDALLHTTRNEHVTMIEVGGATPPAAPGAEMESLSSFIPADHCQAVPVNHLENIDAVFEEVNPVQGDADPSLVAKSGGPSVETPLGGGDQSDVTSYE